MLASNLIINNFSFQTIDCECSGGRFSSFSSDFPAYYCVDILNDICAFSSIPSLAFLSFTTAKVNEEGGEMSLHEVSFRTIVLNGSLSNYLNMF